MTRIIQTPDWPVVTEAEFRRHLRECPDYLRDGYIGSVEYRYRHSNELFTIVIEHGNGEETIYVKP